MHLLLIQFLFVM